MNQTRQYFLSRFADDMTRLSNMTLAELANMKQKAAQQDDMIASLMIEAAWIPTAHKVDDVVWA